MFKKEKNFFSIEEFSKFNIIAGYGCKKFSKENLSNLNIHLIHGVQTHSANIAVIKKENLKENLAKVPFPDTDGLITDAKNVVLYTKHADCLALYFYDKINDVIGICHSGWKGSFYEIGIRMINTFEKEFKSKKENLIIGIGIGISLDNYEVSKEFYNSFLEKFSSFQIDKCFLEKDHKFYFDNEKFNYNLLKSLGIKEENIICSNLCTYNDLALNSFRRDKEQSGRNLAFITNKQ